MKKNFVLKIDFADLPELIETLIQSSEELRLAKEGKYVNIEAKALDMNDALSSRFAMLYPRAELYILHNGNKERFEPELPDVLRGVINCPNPNCVTSQPKEPAIPEFLVVSRKPLLLLCGFCGRYLRQEDIKPSLFKVTKKF